MVFIILFSLTDIVVSIQVVVSTGIKALKNKVLYGEDCEQAGASYVVIHLAKVASIFLKYKIMKIILLIKITTLKEHAEQIARSVFKNFTGAEDCAAQVLHDTSYDEQLDSATRERIITYEAIFTQSTATVEIKNSYEQDAAHDSQIWNAHFSIRFKQKDKEFTITGMISESQAMEGFYQDIDWSASPDVPGEKIKVILKELSDIVLK